MSQAQASKSNQTFVDVNLTPNTPIAQAVILENVHVEFNENMKNCLQKARVIHIICLFDILMGLIYSIYYPMFLFPLLASITGYCGSKKFNKTLIIFYITYLFFNVIFRIVNIGFIINSQETQVTMLLFSALILLIDFFIIWYIVKFYKLLTQLLESEIYYLRSNLNVQNKFIC